jgi:hypothetical protein
MAYEFLQASSQYLSLPTGDIPSPTLPITVAGWIYDPDTGSSDRVFYGYGRTVTLIPMIRAYRTANRQVIAQVRDDASVVANPAGLSYNANVWVNAGARVEANAQSAFRNGTVGTAQTVSIGTQTLNTFAIGAFIRTGITNYMQGQIAEVAVWSAALTNDEITALARGFKAHRIRPQSLLYYSPLIRDLQDVREARTITNNNSATVADHPRVY